MKIINKFGGEIIGNLGLVRQAVRRLKEQLENKQKPVVVVSALAGVTDKLEKLGVLIFSTGVAKVNTIIEELTQQYLCWAKRLKINNQALEKDIQNLSQKLEKDLQEFKKTKNKLAHQDKILSYGEKFSSLLFAELLNKEGIRAAKLTGEEIGLITDDNFGDANIIYKESFKNIGSRLKNFSGVPVIAGFVGKARGGETTTLGRGGSDTTACLLGSVFAPSKVVLWKNVPGVLSADPRIVKNAKTIKSLTYGEAEESGKVIHDKAIILLKGKNVTLEVAYITDPSQKTIVADNAPSGKGVKIISSKGNLSFWVITSDKITRPGALSEIADIIRRDGINMALIRNTKETLYIVVERNNHNLSSCRKKIEELGYRVLAEDVAMVNAVGNMDLGQVEKFNHLLYKTYPEAEMGAFPYRNCLRLEAIVEPSKVKKLINIFHKEFIEN